VVVVVVVVVVLAAPPAAVPAALVIGPPGLPPFIRSFVFLEPGDARVVPGGRRRLDAMRPG